MVPIARTIDEITNENSDASIKLYSQELRDIILNLISSKSLKYAEFYKENTMLDLKNLFRAKFEMFNNLIHSNEGVYRRYSNLENLHTSGAKIKNTFEEIFGPEPRKNERKFRILFLNLSTNIKIFLTNIYGGDKIPQEVKYNFDRFLDRISGMNRAWFMFCIKTIVEIFAETGAEALSSKVKEIEDINQNYLAPNTLKQAYNTMVKIIDNIEFGYEAYSKLYFDLGNFRIFKERAKLFLHLFKTMKNSKTETLFNSMYVNLMNGKPDKNILSIKQFFYSFPYKEVQINHEKIVWKSIANQLELYFNVKKGDIRI